MTKSEIVERLLNPGVIAIIRADSSEHLVDCAKALIDGGVTAMEVTMTTPDALNVITEISAKYSNQILMGVGTVIDADTCREAILAGAEFVVTPVTKPDVIRICNRYSKPIACGAFTPTEALLAHETGADFVKIFPADQVGPTYIKNILAPLPMLRLIPTGGVSPNTIPAFIQAGSVAVGAGSTLVSKEAMKRGDMGAITSRAREFVDSIMAARAR